MHTGFNCDRTIPRLHFGVNSGAACFAIENQAVNEANFRCCDEMGWKPQKVPIVTSDGGISRTRETSLPVEEITKALAEKGYEVMASDDAGRLKVPELCEDRFIDIFKDYHVNNIQYK
ncbi:unnamed protein product [Sphenostylis stenocarpa]|uniref:Uncharacterized protein n=1 Tax=Sphenostylis stenocarpa TaxID=92480 RepID=A0AA86RSX9_9FABA|nr:unnamed protein product [Sphenostylis stenocarpa]